MGDLVLHGFYEVGEDGAFAGLDEAFDGHARHEGLAVQLWHFAFQNLQACQIERLAGDLIAGQVRGNVEHGCAQLRCGALVESSKAHISVLSHLQLIHIDRLNTTFNHQITVFRHYQHECVTRCDYAANGMNVELMHITGLRGADVNALEAVLRCHFLLFQLGNL
ncbi:hypothetical protein PsAD37_03425 [Pseudovibrio sp. Ad37]|nr:hypothetical protein PsAD37_03425 [Pseudovibrio sp. Ad37]